MGLNHTACKFANEFATREIEFVMGEIGFVTREIGFVTKEIDFFMGSSKEFN